MKLLRCEFCGHEANAPTRIEDGIQVYVCRDCGAVQRWCPDCDQGWIDKVALKEGTEVRFVCSECESLWAERPTLDGSRSSMSAFLKERGLPWDGRLLTRIEEKENA